MDPDYIVVADDSDHDAPMDVEQPPPAYTAIASELAPVRVTAIRVGPRKVLLQLSSTDATLDTTPDPVSPPVHLVLVLDTSGSMGSATRGRVDGELVELASTRLDLAVHTAKVLAASLDKADRLSVVTFGTTASVLLDAVPMSQDGVLTMVYECLDAARAAGGTYMRPALGAARSCIRRAALTSHAGTIVFLTDGEPSDGSGHATDAVEEQLALDQATNSALPPIRVHTVAFDRANMATSMMINLARWTGGTMRYMDGPNMIATTASCLLATIKTEYISHLRVYNPNTTDGLPKPLYAGRDSFGGLRQGQDRFHLLVVPEEIPQVVVGDDLGLTVYGQYFQGQWKHFEVSAGLVVGLDGAMGPAIDQLSGVVLGLEMARYITPGDPRGLVGLELKKRLQALLEPAAAAAPPALVHTVNTQVLPAIESQAVFAAWGEKYLAAVGDALFQQVCPNDRDLALQGYKSPAFDTVVNRCMRKFSDVPLTIRAGASQAQVPSMRQLANPTGGCYHESSRVVLENGETMLVGDVVKGTVLFDGEVVEAILECDAAAWYVRIGELLITDWHPIYHAGGWCAPAEIDKYPISSRLTGKMRSFLLVASERSGTVLMATGPDQAVRTAALGHQQKDVPGLSHPFWGVEVRACMYAHYAKWTADGVLVMTDVARAIVDGVETVVGLVVDE